MISFCHMENSPYVFERPASCWGYNCHCAEFQPKRWVFQPKFKDQPTQILPEKNSHVKNLPKVTWGITWSYQDKVAMKHLQLLYPFTDRVSILAFKIWVRKKGLNPLCGRSQKTQTFLLYVGFCVVFWWF